MTHGNIDFIYFAEVCVDQAMGLALCGLFLTMVLMSFLVSFMIDSSLGMAGTFYVYAGTSFIGVIFNLAVIKETKGRTPSQLAMLYVPQKKVKNSEVEVAEQNQNAANPLD